MGLVGELELVPESLQQSVMKCSMGDSCILAKCHKKLKSQHTIKIK